MPLKLYIDKETKSVADLRVVGAHAYADHPSTDILCIGAAFDDEPVHVYRPAEFPREMLEFVKKGGIVVAHNFPFEGAVWNAVGRKKYGFPPLPPEQGDCTMARSFAMAIPGDLDGARAAMGITQEKDEKGRRLMLKMSKPKAVRKGKEVVCDCKGAGTIACTGCFGTGRVVEWHNEPDQWERLFEYCRQDVEVERALDKRLLPLSKNEKKIWLLDYEINCRGVRIDRKAAEKAVDLVNTEEMRLHGEMRKITEEQVASCKAHLQLKTWLKLQGVDAQGVAKDAVIELLSRPDLPDRPRAALEIRQEAAKSSTAKLKTMLARAGSDERIKGLFQYHGANTGRWSGRSVQLQNLPKPTILHEQEDIEEVFQALEERSLVDARDYIDIFHGSPMTVMSDCIRGFLVPSPGKDFIAMDFSSIEARITRWLAGQDDVLELFRRGEDVYIAAAANTYRVPRESITKKDPRRQIGKVEELAFGFEGGVGAILSMCKAYNLNLEPAFAGLWAITNSEKRERVLKGYDNELRRAQKAKKPPVPKKLWIVCELLKLAWRESNPEVVKFWRLIEKAAILAVEQPGVKHTTGNEGLPPIDFVMKGSFLFCRLPSGRRLTYPYPQVETKETPWGQPKKMLTYKFEHPTTRKWVRGATYGGSICENVVQATSACVLRDAMVNATDHGYPLVMHVHDEVVTEVDENFGSIGELESIVTELPAWASGLPIAAEGWRGKRYRK